MTFRAQLYRRDPRWTSVRGTPFPRCHDKTDNAGKPSSSTPRNRSARYLHTTTRGVQTVGARLMHHQRESPIADRPATPRPAVPTHCRSHLLVAGDRLPSHTGGRQHGFTCCTTELGRTAAVCGRPCSPYRQLCVGG